MTFVLIILALCVLGVLANRFGFDSRTQLRSNEEEAANWGMQWEGAYQGR